MTTETPTTTVAPTTLASFEQWLNTQPSWNRGAAGACLVLKSRLDTGEAPFAAVRDAVADQHHHPLARTAQTAAFAALTAA